MRKPMSEENIKRFPTNTPDHLSAGAIWTSIKLTDIVDIDQTQIREQYDEGVIDELKRLFNWQNPYGNDDNDKNYYPAELNEIDVVRCPQDKNKLWIIDGHHRYQAALATGKETIRAMIVNNNGKIKSLKVNDIDDGYIDREEAQKEIANVTKLEILNEAIPAAFEAGMMYAAKLVLENGFVPNPYEDEEDNEY